MKLKHGSLFSGIGGFDYAAACLGWDNAFHCEINSFCSKILNHWFPKAEHYEDITKTDFTRWRGQIDVLSGGFPCQPFSLAGQRKGAEDDRYLWPEMLRVIREVQPTWVLGENVAGIATMVQPGKEVEVASGCSLFGEDNRKRVLFRQEYVIETVCSDLEREGYSVQPIVIPACAVGAPHRRDRVWFIAHRTDTGAEAVQQAGKNGTKLNPNSQNGKGLTALAVNGLLPTPIASDIHHADRVRNLKNAGAETIASRKNGNNRPNGLMDFMDFHGILPTPMASDATTGAIIGENDTFIVTKNGTPRKINQNGQNGSVGLGRIVQMLPTPTSSCHYTGTEKCRKDGRPRDSQLNHLISKRAGKPSQLNPLFVAEMMSFPPDWTVLPFLSGDKSPSKPTGMP